MPDFETSDSGGGAARKEQDEENAVGQLVDMGFSREQAVAVLRDCNYDVSKAIEHIFNGGPIEKVEPLIPDSAVAVETGFQPATAEESRWLQHRQDAKGRSDGHFEHEHDLEPTAPSQEQSANDSQIQSQPSQFQYPSLQDPHASNNSGTQYATAATVAHAQYGPQISGGYDNASGGGGAGGGGQFAVATRDYYDSQQWGMVPVKTAGGEEYDTQLDFQPRSALRSRDVPPVLLPSPEMLYIAPLITVLHKIPLARKAILQEPENLVNYGFHPQWWNYGIVDMSQSFTDTVPFHDPERLLIETQRLFAFLDGTSRRAMATITNLASEGALLESREALRGGISSESPPGRFIEDLQQYWGPDSEFAQAFFMKAADRTFAELVADVTVGIEESLYEVIDELVWPPDTPGDTYLEEIGEIIHITLKRDDGTSGAGISIPTVFYPGRYLKDNLPFMIELRNRREAAVQELSALNAQKFKLSTTMGKDTLQLLKLTEDYLKQMEDEGENTAELEETKAAENISLPENPTDQNQGEGQAITKNGISSAFAEVSNVRSRFETRRIELVDKVNRLSRQMELEAGFCKGPGSPELEEVFGKRPPELLPYHLRGAVISPTEYCFLCPDEQFSEPDLIEMDDGQENRSVWWRVASDRSGEPVAQIVTEAEVLQCIKEGSREYSWQEVILVYASDRALDPSNNQELSDKLRTFLSKDKHAVIKDQSTESQANIDPAEPEHQRPIELPPDPSDGSTPMDVDTVDVGGETAPSPELVVGVDPHVVVKEVRADDSDNSKT